MNFLLKILFLPITLIYVLSIRIRNFLFDIGVFKSESYPFPLISVGNLSVGGTGKTPHVEFIINLLKSQYHLATLSRGYGRQSKGFKLADSHDDAFSIGDEPFQIFRKFPNIMVAVDGDRKRGIGKLTALPSPPEVILLDDAFQHRYVKPGFNILLTDYSNLYTEDIPLPSGRLREYKSSARRADIIIVTKSPKVLSSLEIRRITNSLNPRDYQKVFFSFIEYEELVPLNEAAVKIQDKKNKLSTHAVLLVSAIANPKSLLLHFNRFAKEIASLNFRDHHFFALKDYEKIKKKLSQFLSPQKMIVVTEKDSVKFDAKNMDPIPVFCMPIKIQFHQHGDDHFSSEIDEYVRSYRRNQKIH